MKDAEQGFPDDEALAQAHARLVQDRAFQFERTGLESPDLSWLDWVARLFAAIEPALRWIFWIGLAAIAGMVLLAILREVWGLRRPPARPEQPTRSSEADWRPDAQTARDLLAEADRLAERGLYPEAVHLLLLRSVTDIEMRRPNLLRDSLTTREIASLEGIPDSGRTAFDLIGRVVERSLFGKAQVSAGEFADCRRAYEAFALPGGWRA